MRAAIYVRFSADPQGTALGVERQRADCEALCERRSWKVAEVYVDNDVSATSSKPRPAYARLLEDIDAGVVDAVVVWDLDRLYRKPAELEDFMLLAEKYSPIRPTRR